MNHWVQLHIKHWNATCNFTMDFQFEYIVNVYKINNNGPRVFPCGVPIPMFRISLLIFSILTYCFLFVGKLFMISCAWPRTPYLDNLYKRILCGIVSNALIISRNKQAVIFFLEMSSGLRIKLVKQIAAESVPDWRWKPNWFSFITLNFFMKL